MSIIIILLLLLLLLLLLKGRFGLLNLLPRVLSYRSLRREREGRARVGRVGERTWERGCGLFTFSSRRQVSREIQPKPEFQTFLRVEGMSDRSVF